ncbi:stimulator of interferon genes protein isoform X2 [Polyodon spathula]|nr:stimulator of interferon genes protein isoform X2 [Polyodon spathula]XP_041079620.1 stimulator of interferon genes protein isoform X2 [Polyodon spathula]
MQVHPDNPEIPQPRGPLARYSAICFGILLSVFALIVQTDDIFHCFAVPGLIFSFCGILKGVCHLSEEIVFQFRPRYRSSLIEVLKACFSWKNVCVAVFLCFVSIKLEDWICILTACACFMLFTGSQFWSPTAVEISTICENRKMNVAHGLAWSFYIGYLKLVLPKLKDSIQIFCDKNKNSILKCKDTWKLHILMPLSCTIPDKLEDEDSNIVFLENLPDIVIDRAGVRTRVYKHSLYAIYDDAKRPHHCVLEYATPLLSLYGMSNESLAEFSREDRLEQAKLFYRTLKDILDNSRDCRNSYRFIMYDDSQAAGDPHFLSKEILKHLQQQEKEEYSLSEGSEVQTDQHEAMSQDPTLMISNEAPRSLLSHF